MVLVYKICSAAEWDLARANGDFTGSLADRADGYIHLSASGQVKETASKHFANRADLVLVAYDETDLDGLRWERSRGGDLFPHVYGSLPTAKALWVKPLALIDGTYQFPDET